MYTSHHEWIDVTDEQNSGKDSEGNSVYTHVHNDVSAHEKRF